MRRGVARVESRDIDSLEPRAAEARAQVCRRFKMHGVPAPGRNPDDARAHELLKLQALELPSRRGGDLFQDKCSTRLEFSKTGLEKPVPFGYMNKVENIHKRYGVKTRFVDLIKQGGPKLYIYPVPDAGLRGRDFRFREVDAQNAGRGISECHFVRDEPVAATD